MAENILKKPLVTEKMTGLSETKNTYGFIVDKKANKLQVKKAVEDMYGVTVDKVRTAISPGKARYRHTKTSISKGATSALKKAYVTLAEGETIDFYSNI